MGAGVLNVGILFPYGLVLVYAAFDGDYSPWGLFGVGMLVAATAALATFSIIAGMRGWSRRVVSSVAVVACLATITWALVAIAPTAGFADALSQFLFYSPVILVPALSVWALWLLRHPWRLTQCANCGYDLTGSPGEVCPECGHERGQTVTLVSHE
jgi:hypothetical protein